MSINWEDPRSGAEQQDSQTETDNSDSDSDSDAETDSDSESIETAVASTMTGTSGSPTEDESQPTDADTAAESSDSAFRGFASGGMTVTETVTAVVFAAGAWWTAYSVLMQIVAHGTHHAPNMLWGAFLFLIVLPVFLVMGTSVGTRMFDMATQVRSGSGSGSETDGGSNRQ